MSGFRLDKYLVTVGRFRQFVSRLERRRRLLASRGVGQAHALERRPGAREQRTPPGDVRDGMGRVADNGNIAPTDANLDVLPDPQYRRRGRTSPGASENLPDQLRELVRGVRVLHLGRRVPAERGGVGVRRGWREPAARVPVGLDCAGDGDNEYAIYG